MKSIIATTATLFFAATAIAGPVLVERDTLYATVSLSNEQDGAWGNVQVPIDNLPHSVQDLWKDTNVNHGGSIRASSSSLNGGLANFPLCIFRDGGLNEKARIYAGSTSQKTYAKFGDNPNMLNIVSLVDWTVTCEKTW